MVGVEPSGDAFNAIELQNGTNRPFNPMINRAPITITALRMRNLATKRSISSSIGSAPLLVRTLQIDQAVFESERRAGHRNRAIAHLLLNFACPRRAESALDVSSPVLVLVSSRDLAVMAQRSPNMDRNPMTQQTAYDLATVRSHDWRSCSRAGCTTIPGNGRTAVGVPAKSGVAGGVLAVVNRQLESPHTRHASMRVETATAVRSLCRIGVPVRPPRRSTA